MAGPGGLPIDNTGGPGLAFETWDSGLKLPIPSLSLSLRKSR